MLHFPCGFDRVSLSILARLHHSRLPRQPASVSLLHSLTPLGVGNLAKLTKYAT